MPIPSSRSLLSSSRRPLLKTSLSLLVFAVSAGCTGILGDFTVSDVVTPQDGATVTEGGGGGDAEAGATCAAPTRACPNGTCAGPEDPRACGPSCIVCPAPTGGTPVCTPAGVCEGRCPGTAKACGGACRDVTTDKDHCGDCGRSCGGGDCVAGQCRPVTLTATLTKATDIALSPNDVFVNADGKVRRCAKTGCAAATPLWAGGDLSVPGPHMLAIDLNYAYFAQDIGANRFLSRCQLGGCASSPQQITVTPAPPPGNFEALAVEGSSYFFAGTYSGVREAPLGGGAVTRSYSNFAGTGFPAANAQYVVWSDKFGGGVRQCARSGAGCTTSTELTAGVTTTELLVFAGRAIFVAAVAGGTEIQGCNVVGCSGAPTVIAREPASTMVTGLAVDPSGVYWSTSSGEIRACKVAGGCAAGGGTVVDLARSQAGVSAVATDAEFVYWVTDAVGTGAIRRVRK
ncbi:MAG: hypothetical protein JST00_16740 [Deltaproteobacteria bacterium]|nr:hypothetical protein [Deltaproteobacteria bacterium]